MSAPLSDEALARAEAVAASGIDCPADVALQFIAELRALRAERLRCTDERPVSHNPGSVAPASDNAGGTNWVAEMRRSAAALREAGLIGYVGRAAPSTEGGR